MKLLAEVRALCSLLDSERRGVEAAAGGSRRSVGRKPRGGGQGGQGGQGGRGEGPWMWVGRGGWLVVVGGCGWLLVAAVGG